jgi:hypothetical protein
LAEFTVRAAASRLTQSSSSSSSSSIQTHPEQQQQHPDTPLPACVRACCYEKCGFAPLLLSMVASGPQGSNLYTLSECSKFCTCGPARVIEFCWSWHYTVIAVEGGGFCVLKVHFWVHCTWSDALTNTQLPRRRALTVLHIFIVTFLYCIVPFVHLL